jgi:hypothetical protein
MGTHTRYLVLHEESREQFRVRAIADGALSAITDALQRCLDLRYSPILPAYLIPDEEPPPPPGTLHSVAFFFARNPYQALGQLRTSLSQAERERIFFTQGLASLIMLNCDADQARRIKEDIACLQAEHWQLQDGVLATTGVTYLHDTAPPTEGMVFDLASGGSPELDVYVEQLAASISSLWFFHGTYFPEERTTMIRILAFAKRIIQQHRDLGVGTPTLKTLKQQNAIVSALVELSAALSYSVTQGTSGVSPILANKGPFPHHSLLGVGGAIRALTKFTRTLEAAFSTRDATAVISDQYASKHESVPFKISMYDSGPSYTFPREHDPKEKEATEEFDKGGDFPTAEHIPLLCHFSLRHGFKEAKFSVTAASESLSAECLPAWTVMTLSHEIMHSRVRDIFYALFGTTWQEDDAEARWDRFYDEFARSYNARQQPTPPPLAEGIRNAVLNFCLATERAVALKTRRSEPEREMSRDEVLTCFRKHRRLASELFVHFHDYYFAYARQPKLYVMSLWASWPTVAAPVARPSEYLVRTLATIACGTGASTDAAFEGASVVLLEALDGLEAVGMRSALYDEIRSLLKDDREATIALFKCAYFLMDQVRKYFASRHIADKIDRLTTDPFAEGSTVAEESSASIFVHGEENTSVSPIRYSLAALARQLVGGPVINDVQWLTAWNSMVIAS